MISDNSLDTTGEVMTMRRSIRMRHVTLFLALAGLGIGIAGCAWVHQDAQLSLHPQITGSMAGQGTTVRVRVIDRREDRVIGYRGVDSKNASITTEQNLTAMFQQAIIDGLTRKGFRAVPFADEQTDVLTVELRQLNYTTDMEFWKGIVQTTCALRAIASRNAAAFDQTYVGARKEYTVEAPRAKTNDRIISAAMSDALQRLFEDTRLTAFLAGN